ncbi:MAG: HD domain-containing protein [Planctomycetota bacterium]|nr:HD domain-containing protein [Planctomycetota bacterium]
MDRDDIWQQSVKCAPRLCAALLELSNEWTPSIIRNLDARINKEIAFPKTFNDPIWGPINLYEWEVAILDSPLLQRLRGVLQLGSADYVYPGATHTRLNHTIGVIEVATRIIKALETNATYRREFGTNRDENIALPGKKDILPIRLAALLHDIGHGAFSHATESLLELSYVHEIPELQTLFLKLFPARKPTVSELVAALLVLSEPMHNALMHARIEIPQQDKLSVSIAARILGSHVELDCKYLVGVISGPIDADKIDYMSRDSYFSGLPIGMDAKRLISKLEVVTVRPDNTRIPELIKKASESPNQCYYDIGISVAGITAYEQMVVGRVMLYDRVYYHHKVRAAEAMIRRIFHCMEKDLNNSTSVKDTISLQSDATLIWNIENNIALTDSTRDLAGRYRKRNLFHRAYAFAERLIDGLGDLPEEDEEDTRMEMWNQICDVAQSKSGQGKLEDEIYEVATRLVEMAPERYIIDEFSRSDVIVNLPENKVAASGGKLLMKSESGYLSQVNLYFHPEKWSEAFSSVKECGYVFTPMQLVQVVCDASRIVFYERFRTIMSDEALQMCKINDTSNEIFQLAQENGLCGQDAVEAIGNRKVQLVPIQKDEIRLPSDWKREDPTLLARIHKEIEENMPIGFASNLKGHLLDAIESIAEFVKTMDERGEFKSQVKPKEKTELQSELIKFLKARGLDAREGQEISGGESDVILPGEIVVENKVVGESDDPWQSVPDAELQARRYRIGLCNSVAITVIAYKPKTEAAFLKQSERIEIVPMVDYENETLAIRFYVPWGYGNPSDAKAS